MSIKTKISNLKKVTNKLRNKKWKRVQTIIRDYGLREFLRRVKEKMQYGDSAVHLYERIFIVTNESYIKNPATPKGYECAKEVNFITAPGAQNIGKLDILTYNPQKKPAVLTLEIRTADGKLLSTCKTSEIAHNAYTTFQFLPVLDVIHMPLTFTLKSNCENVGVYLNKHRKKHGFTVLEGGCVAAKVYTQLDALYVHWLKNNTPTAQEYEQQRSKIFAYSPKISIIVPLYNTPEHFLREMIDSVRAQTYKNWELCLADGSTTAQNLGEIAASYADSRIVYQRLLNNEGISGNSNAAILLSTGDYIALLDHDDTLMPQALYRNVELLNLSQDYEFIYSDEDKITENGKRRFDPFFKPDFSPDMLYAFNYITHFVVMKKSLLEKVGYFNAEFNGAQDYDLFLRATEQAKKIGHISDVLYNWRVSDTSTAFSSDTKEYTVLAGKAAIEASLKRRGLLAHVKNGALPNYYTTYYDAPDDLVSILIPNKDEPATLKKCIDSILQKTTYPNYEIVIIENNSTRKEVFAYYTKLKQNPKIRVVEWNHPFNYASLNNFAATQAKGNLLLFLNNDVSVISPDWLEQMAMHAVRKEIGAVGAKLYYPDDTLQHGGVILKIGEVAGHSHKHTGRYEVGSFARLTLVHDVSAVTAACVMIRKDVFFEIGGFDEQFVVAFNDVDLCLKIREKGYYIVWTPFAELYHYESKTRGYEETPEKIKRFENEQQKWLAKWDEKYPYDPFYNKNLTAKLEDYSINPHKITL
ncbi:MAG: glycosyltransferase family 2 protein [Christensenellaceae bacterium]